MADNYPKLTELLQTFPSLKDAVFDLDGLAARAEKASSGERHAIAFVARVFNAHAKAGIPDFDAIAALSVWDREHRAAFLAWAADPLA